MRTRSCNSYELCRLSTGRCFENANSDEKTQNRRHFRYRVNPKRALRASTKKQMTLSMLVRAIY